MNKVNTRYNDSFKNYHARVPDPFRYNERQKLISKCLCRSLFTREDVSIYNTSCNSNPRNMAALASERPILHIYIGSRATMGPIMNKQYIQKLTLCIGAGSQPVKKSSIMIY